MKTLLLLMFIGLVSCKYSAPNSPAAAIDNRNRIKTLEQEVYRLGRTQDSLIEALNDQNRGYIWE